MAADVARGRSLPEIFNTDQSSQLTSPEWTGRLEGLGIPAIMDGNGQWTNNVFIERVSRSLKYEDIYLKGYATIGGLEQGLRQWFKRYNAWRPHQNLGKNTPADVYETKRKLTPPTGAEMKDAA